MPQVIAICRHCSRACYVLNHLTFGTMPYLGIYRLLWRSSGSHIVRSNILRLVCEATHTLPMANTRYMLVAITIPFASLYWKTQMLHFKNSALYPACQKGYIGISCCYIFLMNFYFIVVSSLLIYLPQLTSYYQNYLQTIKHTSKSDLFLVIY